MADGGQHTGKKDPVKIDEDLILELNFVPTWARKPPGQQAYFDVREERRHGRHEARRDGDRRSGRDRRPAGGGGRPPQRRMEPRYDQPRGRMADQRRRMTEYVPHEQAPVVVSFLPKPKGLSFIVHRIHSTRRSFPLTELASVFLSNPHYCEVKVESRRGENRARLFQCKKCRMASLTHDGIVAHVIQAHMDEYLVKKEIVGDPPPGQFVCVARCGLSGILLGPPNHHSYQEKLQEVHRTRHAGMPFADYQARVEMVRDEAAIEQWKEESRKRVVYSLKSSKNGEPEELDWSAAESHMRTRVIPSLVTEGYRAVLPMDVAREMEDTALRETIRRAWRRESQAPRSLPFALRGAFRHMHLNVFKAGHDEIFACAVGPSALDPEHVIDSIREVLSYLQEHPGCTRKQMIDELRPGCAPESEEVAELLRPLSWLIEKGHLIEFFDGTLSVPLAAKR